MTFSIYALLGDGAPTVTIHSLATDLQHYFCSEKDFSIKFERLPFAKNENLALRWGGWLVRMSYEEGAHVIQDSLEINKIVAQIAPCDLSKVSRRVRVVIGDDENHEYTNQIVYLVDFLRAIPGVVLFDPQQGDLIQ